MTGDTFYSRAHPDMAAFMQDLKAVFEKHNKIILPTYEGEVSFHDGMRIEPLNTDSLKFVMNAGFDPVIFQIEMK